MFCPKCGSNQGEGKKFCTVCGTNLLIISQALTGQLPQPAIHYAPPVVSPQEIERQQEMRKGITMAILGGGYIVYKLISFIFLLPFSGWRSPFGFLSFIAFIIFASGVSKIFSSRLTAAPPAVSRPAGPAFGAVMPSKSAPPQSFFSRPSTTETAAPRTSELEPNPHPAASVTEEETKHLAH
jgi:hypothetical protein